MATPTAIGMYSIVVAAVRYADHVLRVFGLATGGWVVVLNAQPLDDGSTAHAGIGIEDDVIHLAYTGVGDDIRYARIAIPVDTVETDLAERTSDAGSRDA